MMYDRSRADRPAAESGGGVSVTILRPALASIPNACRYLGDPSRAKFYADILAKLDVVKLGARTMVTVESLDRLIAANRRDAAAKVMPKGNDSGALAGATEAESTTIASSGDKRSHSGPATPAQAAAALYAPDGRPAVVMVDTAMTMPGGSA
jgi:hypothetical protein